MALFKGRLFAGALFAGVILGGVENAPEPPVQEVVAKSPQPSAGQYEGGRSLLKVGHTWVELQPAVRYGGPLKRAEVSSFSRSDATAYIGTVSTRQVTTHSSAFSSGKVLLPSGKLGEVSVEVGNTAVVETRHGVGKLADIRIEYIDLDEILAVLVA